ncbi:MAG: deoxyribodipyrimidine photo-lyase [Nitrospinales bacterium]|jgi:deoxyribodipyrimidine photo-lyase
MRYGKSVCWIRRDLRLKDHVALSEATHCSKEVAVVFVFDTTLLSRLKDKKDRRISFIHQALLEMDQKLRKKGSALIVLHGDPKIEIPEFAQRIKAYAVFANRDYEPFAKKCDKAVQTACNNLGIAFHDFKDQVIFEGDQLATQSETPYKVFTPYKNKWLMELNPSLYHDHRSLLKRLIPINKLHGELVDWSLKKIGFESADLWLKAGQSAAENQLKRFLSDLHDYDKNRDYPSISNGTSHLSVHLRFGTLSVRSLVRVALANLSSGSKTWLSELIWRDFYQMILDQFPHVVKGCFKQEYDRIQWPGTKNNFRLWRKGMTGYPIIDAAMRCFNKTGWMHNRLRMIVASFLTKDLLVDWRKGESWFAQNLLDFDLAANNGGWQWCASTGCDAQPYFRIFNPITQSKRFDPSGSFIREQLPELKKFSNQQIHWPHKTNSSTQKEVNCILGRDYPKPIVIHSEQRDKALGLFKAF